MKIIDVSTQKIVELQKILHVIPVWNKTFNLCTGDVHGLNQFSMNCDP